MPLETGTFIPDLVASNPAHTDGLNQGDGHLRLIKATLQNTFPHFTDVALNSSQSAIDATVNAVTGVSGASAFPAGTAAAPTIAFLGDPDSGFFKIAEDNIGLALNGTQVASFTTAGPTFTGGALVPAGAILMFQGTLPSGWAWMNGSVVSAASNPGLAAIYGSSGGNVTLPDWRCYVPGCQDNLGGSGTTGRIGSFTSMGGVVGETNHTLALGEIPSHSHGVNDPGHAHGINDPGHAHGLSAYSNFFGGGVGQLSGGPGLPYGSGGGPGTDGAGTGISINGAGTGISIQFSGSGGAHNNVQLTVATGFMIKLG